jgi:Fe-S-cluster containining protein
MSQCATCHAGCCRSFVVPVTGADVLRIMSQRRLSFWDFVCRWSDPDGKIALEYAPHWHFRDQPEMPFVISLIQEYSSQFPGTTRCKFLAEGPQSDEHPLGISQCGIYGDRPSACRVFPTKLDHAGELAVLCDVPASGRGGSHPVYRLCPKSWEPADLDPIQQVQDLVVARYEMDFFFKLAAAWNERPGDWLLFPDFLKSVYAKRVLRQDEDRHDEAEPQADEATIIRFPRLAA